jgi:hypothetical protein
MQLEDGRWRTPGREPPISIGSQRRPLGDHTRSPPEIMMAIDWIPQIHFENLRDSQPTISQWISRVGGRIRRPSSMSLPSTVNPGEQPIGPACANGVRLTAIFPKEKMFSRRSAVGCAVLVLLTGVTCFSKRRDHDIG